MAEVHQIFPTEGDGPFEDSNDFSDSHPLGSFGGKIDESVERAWEPFRENPVLNRLFYTASELGDFSLIWHILGLTQGLTRRKGEKDAVRLALALGVESALVNGIIKSAYSRERPTQDEERPHNLRQPLTSSFPSGHASAAFMAASLLSERSKVKPLWFGAAVVVAVSRIQVKNHHASDVIVGAGIGLILGKVIRKLIRFK